MLFPVKSLKTNIDVARRMDGIVMPLVARELDRWREFGASIPNRELSHQAIQSITHKRFHAEGGAIYATASPENADRLVRLIVALQTISDYLDNLCDRTASESEEDFRNLHLSLLDAVDPGRVTSDYYRLHPNKDDGGYLQALVDECRQQLAFLPSYETARPHVVRLVYLYSDLQALKHLIPAELRHPRLMAWYAEHQTEFPEVSWFEFAAATGSTLGMFALFLASLNPSLAPAQAEAIVRAYFPWVSGLHILLDSVIDQQEDRDEGDQNFMDCYRNQDEMRSRLKTFIVESMSRVRTLPDPAFHQTVVTGLLAVYLSDRKIEKQRLSSMAWDLLRCGGSISMVNYLVLRWYRGRRGGV